MGNIENYSLFGFNLGGGKKPEQYAPSAQEGADLSGFLSGILGGAFFGLGLRQLLSSLDENRLNEFFWI